MDPQRKGRIVTERARMESEVVPHRQQPMNARMGTTVRKCLSIQGCRRSWVIVKRALKEGKDYILTKMMRAKVAGFWC